MGKGEHFFMNKNNIYALSWNKDKSNIIKEVDWWLTFHMIEYSIFSKLLANVKSKSLENI
jgi:hypothetical protein